MKKEKIKTIAIILLFLLLALASVTFAISQVNEFKAELFNRGIQQGVINVAIKQTNTGNIFYINNNTIATMPLAEICGNQIKET